MCLVLIFLYALIGGAITAGVNKYFDLHRSSDEANGYIAGIFWPVALPMLLGHELVARLMKKVNKRS